LTETYKNEKNIQIFKDTGIESLYNNTDIEYVCYIHDTYSPLIGYLIHAYEESAKEKCIYFNNVNNTRTCWFSPIKSINSNGEVSKNSYVEEYKNTQLKVSIIIPVIRPNLLERCVSAIKTNAEYDNYEIITEEDVDRIGCPKMVKKLVERTTGDAVMFLGDDTIPQPGFLKNAVNQLKSFKDNIGLVALNDGTNRRMLATHWLAHKKILPIIGGEFFHTGYHHCYCDNELSLRTQLLDLYAYCHDSVIEHDNPILKKTEMDEHYKRAYSFYEQDRVLFENRKRDICS
jgi:hypothetical protein